jgi:hypothetical protein
MIISQREKKFRQIKLGCSYEGEEKAVTPRSR